MDYRELFSGIDVPIVTSEGKEIIPINFDNAATTPPLKQVDAFVYENMLMYGSIGRGGHKSSYCTEAYELSREEVLHFFNLSKEDHYTTIYVKNTTEGLNLLANILCDRNHQRVLITRMEHHTNDLCWRRIAQPFYWEVDEAGDCPLETLEKILTYKQDTIQYVSVTGASNVTGYRTPIHQIARIVHAHGALLIVDGAQLVAHAAIDMKGASPEEAIDFLVFSGHKMYAPFGSGVIVGRKDIIEQKAPFLVGGGMAAMVFDDDVFYKPSPYKDEAGTPNFMGAMSIIAAMTILKQIGFKQIEVHEQRLRKRLLTGLKALPKVILYGRDKQQLGVIPFNVEGIHHDEVGKRLQDLRGIAVRTGCFCAQPYVMRLLKISDEARYGYLMGKQAKRPGMVRASLALYNTEEEVDEFLNCLEQVIKMGP